MNQNLASNQEYLLRTLESPQGWGERYRDFEEQLAKLVVTGIDWGGLENWLIKAKPVVYRRAMMLLEQLMHQDHCLYQEAFKVVTQGRQKLGVATPIPGPIDYQARWDCDLMPIDCLGLKARLYELEEQSKKVITY